MIDWRGIGPKYRGVSIFGFPRLIATVGPDLPV